MSLNPVLLGFLLAATLVAAPTSAAKPTDTLKTSAGDLTITHLGHGSLMFAVAGQVIHIDPFGRVADYNSLPQADLILLTHHHADHLDPGALAKVRTGATRVILTAACAEQVPGGTVLGNGESLTSHGLGIQALPAYNLVHRRDSGELFHPPGVGNGYLVTFGGTRVYIAGDTENIPEMKALRDIDIAFLPMNLPYTMTPQMVADAARAFRPRILYPYHYGATDTAPLVELLRDAQDIEVRIR